MSQVCLKNITVHFPTLELKDSSLKASLLGAVGGRFTTANDKPVVEALRGIDLDLRDGDRLGILGHNGAGKTTLLKICAGIYEPSAGEAHIEGNVASMTDMLMGLDPEVSGNENILRRCVFMGLSLKQSRQLMPKIEEFSELGDYLKLPMRTYSTGMFMRLAYSISTISIPDILILDEMVNAGDLNFMAKAQKRTDELIEHSKIIILASHDMTMLQHVCKTGLWLEHGQCRFLGPIEEAVERYQKSLLESDQTAN